MALHKPIPRAGSWAATVNTLAPIAAPTLAQILAPTYSGRAGAAITLKGLHHDDIL